MAQDVSTALVIALALLGLPAQGNAVSSPPLPVEERQALLSFFASTGGDQWQVKTGWGGAVGSECDWYGVSCDWEGGNAAATPHVDFLFLLDNGLVGAIPKSVGDLRHLKSVDLSWNRLTGSVPDFWLERWDRN